MMKEVSAVKQGTDVVLFITDPKEKPEEVMEIISNLKIKTPLILVINKSDKIKPDLAASLVQIYKSQKSIDQVVLISALQKQNLDHLLQQIIHCLPIMPPYYDEDTLTDKPMRFFVAEMIREKLFFELDEELPYHAAVIVRQYEEKTTLTKIVADIVVSRDTQKFILIGKGGSMIKKIGQLSREDIEKFIDRKVFLELHVKVRKDWRNNDLYLKEYGY
jgi:GTP-binding protein Era